MHTKFNSKTEAEEFIRALEAFYGVGVFHRIYRGHRNWRVHHDEYLPNNKMPAPTKVQAGDKVEDEKSKVLIGDGSPIW